MVVIYQDVTVPLTLSSLKNNTDTLHTVSIQSETARLVSSRLIWTYTTILLLMFWRTPLLATMDVSHSDMVESMSDNRKIKD